MIEVYIYIEEETNNTDPLWHWHQTKMIKKCNYPKIFSFSPPLSTANVVQSLRTFRVEPSRWRTKSQTWVENSHCRRRWSLVSVAQLQRQQEVGTFIPHLANLDLTGSLPRWEIQKVKACLGTAFLYQIALYQVTVWVYASYYKTLMFSVGVFCWLQLPSNFIILFSIKFTIETRNGEILQCIYFR